jgi:hypothetical protein
MGLDMYARWLDETPDTPVDFEVDDYGELHYWRKHPNLHGWMKRLYREKGGRDEAFNCAPLLLALEDLNRLEADIRAGELPETTGFFFGISGGSETGDGLDFIAKAREIIAEGLVVYYTAWW